MRYVLEITTKTPTSNTAKRRSFNKIAHYAESAEKAVQQSEKVFTVDLTGTGEQARKAYASIAGQGNIKGVYGVAKVALLTR